MSDGLRFASLGSGSRGNATVVESGATRVLVDCGFSVRETLKRLARAGVDPESLAGILVTHEHADHASGVPGFAARFRLPVFLSAGTHRALEARGCLAGVKIEWNRILRGVPFTLGALAILPVRVPHDAQEPCQFVFESAGAKFGLLTDIGDVTPQVVAAYGGCHALLLESNHDVAMLRSGPYPPALRARVGGEFGHMSNDQTAQLLRAIDVSCLQTLVLAHLSEQNNQQSLARRAAAAAIGWQETAVRVASQAEGHDWVQVRTQTACVAGHAGA